MFRRPFIVTIEIPALADLVAYLRESDQAHLDAVTATVEGLTARLNQSRTQLQTAINEESK